MVDLIPVLDYSQKGKSPFSENLRKLRKDKHMSQEDLGRLINKSVETVGKYESGESLPPINVLADLCKVLECTPDRLLGYITESSNSIKYITDITGLSEKAINRLKDMKYISPKYKRERVFASVLWPDLVSKILENDKIDDFLDELSDSTIMTFTDTTSLGNGALISESYRLLVNDKINGRLYKLSRMFTAIMEDIITENSYFDLGREKDNGKYQ